ncbi:hypothetical protein LTLLF_165990 [Microtus ochrogaster]|uniref:Uncharacterized protein n=1 Tax=Microtus ochrogaster TaxID=79684 RepID=A0A8J6G8H5_MICOH|nr:hypothetical protein LTLLF_165990 [Microtus ochrogaster]
MYTQEELSLYTPFILIGPVFVQMVQQPPMVYRYWAGMEYWIAVSYPCQVFIPLASLGLYFVQPSFMIYVFRTPWSLTYNAQ